MTDEIRKVIASALQDARHEGQRIRFSDGYADAMTEAAIYALHAAGYEIVPGWSDDLDSAPRDGTPILVIDVNAERPVAAYVWWDAPREWDDDEEGVWRTVEPEIFEVIGGSATFPTPTHWKPITPPKESGE